ncbi:MAG: OsmC family protein [Candidatus Eisenbacteria sp.]|nr:OsmC family protein [Candidatus Eisenbacteria bacterium]
MAGQGVTTHSESRWEQGGAFEHLADSGVAYRSDALVEGEEGRPLTGPKPMELLLGAVGGCTGVDLVSILIKMRVVVRSLRIVVEGERALEHPRVFRRVHIDYRIATEPHDLRRVRRAVELSTRKYCGASATLASTGTVTYALHYGDECIEGVVPGVTPDARP